jgi:hypothetical protein
MGVLWGRVGGRGKGLRGRGLLVGKKSSRKVAELAKKTFRRRIGGRRVGGGANVAAQVVPSCPLQPR